MRLRDVLAVMVGLALVAALGYVAWGWLRDLLGGSEEPPPVSTAEGTVAAYLDAWSQGDHEAMEALLRTPVEGFADRHRQLVDGLRASSIELVAGTPAERAEGRLAYPVIVSAHAPYSTTPISWQVELVVERERGQWGVAWTLASLHADLRPGWRFDTEERPVEREPILAVGGEQLAGDGAMLTFGFEPSRVTDRDLLVSTFEEVLPGTGRIAQRELSRTNLVDGWFYPIASLHGDRAMAAWDRLRPVPGVLRQTQEGRILHDQAFAQHVVGVITEATAEQLQALGMEVRPGVMLPQYGLERDFEDALVGSPVVVAGLREGEGGPMRVVLADAQAQPSGPLRTTIDVAVQRAVEDAISGVTTGAIVVVDTADGAIRGVASRPLSGYNRAFEGRYPPGSTFKIVVLEALLATGASLDDRVACPGTTVVGGLRVRNAGDVDLGTVSLLEAFAASCNTTFATLGAQLGASELAAAAERFGAGTPPLAALDAFGLSVPAPADTAELGASSFGQARVQSSALHLASVAAAARSGTWHQPYLLADDGPGASQSLAPGTLESLRRAMRSVVTSGTGRSADVAGVEVEGKTGTAQASGGVEHAWFAGSIDGYGFAVLVEAGGAGGAVAGPVAARLAEGLATASPTP